MDVVEHSWTFLTNHGQALVHIARDPDVRLRDLGDRVGITERAAHRIVSELVSAGYITRAREGRRNRYTVNDHLPLPDPVANHEPIGIGGLLEILTGSDGNRSRRSGDAATRRAGRASPRHSAP